MCRLIFFWLNWDSSLGGTAVEAMARYFLTGLELDLTVAVVTNAAFLLAALARLRRRWEVGLLRGLFVGTNGAVVLASLCDAVFYHYTERRFTAGMVAEFANESNLLRLGLGEAAQRWYLLGVFMAVVCVLWIASGWLFGQADCEEVSSKKEKRRWEKYVAAGLAVVVAGVALSGRRIFNPAERLDNQFLVEQTGNFRKTDFAINTPMKLVFSLADKQFEIADYYTDEELAQLHPTVHQPIAGIEATGRNVVVVIVEGLSRGMVTDGLMPFTRELMCGSTRFTRSYANGTVSIDALPAVFCSLPRVKVPYATTHLSNRHIPSMARELAGRGYATAMFHGGNDASMGFRAFAESIGFGSYYGRSAYEADPRFGGEADFDGTWAIWDEEFLQFTALKLSEFAEPFLAGIFTATSHHPYAVPERYADALGDGETLTDVERCVRYTDLALRRFFETASKQPWFANTIFVVTGDHANTLFYKRRKASRLSSVEIPIFIYDPQEEAPRLLDATIQQIDIMPTVLRLLGHDRSFTALGKDALADAQPSDAGGTGAGGGRTDTDWAFNCINYPTYIEGGYALSEPQPGKLRLCHVATDSLMSRNLTDSLPELTDRMHARMKAILQSYKKITER